MTEPERPQRIQRVAAYNVCVDADDRLLLCRLSAVTEAPGSWTLPGGGIDFGEHPERGAVRELREETGLIGRIAELLAVDSLHRPARPGEGGHEYHSIRVIYRTVIEGGDREVFASCSTVSELPRLVTDADWLIVTVPLTSRTRGLIGREVLSACRGAVLINTGRGEVVDESLLPEALDAGWLAGAALDVFAVEPLPAASPLWDDARVMISPHMSGLTTVEGAVEGFLECLAEIEQGRLPARTVDRAREY